MRLDPTEIAAIKQAAQTVFGGDAVVRLFGSRTDDDSRGGDIDLHVEVPAGQATWEKECALVGLIQDAIGEQRIDVVLHPPERPLATIDRIAIETGVVL